LRKELIANYSTGVIVLVGLIRLAFSAVPTDLIESLFANLHAAIQKAAPLSRDLEVWDYLE